MVQLWLRLANNYEHVTWRTICLSAVFWLSLEGFSWELISHSLCADYRWNNSNWVSLFSHSTRNEQSNYLIYHPELCHQRKLVQSSICTHTKTYTHFKITLSCPVGSTISYSVNLPPFVNENKAFWKEYIIAQRRWTDLLKMLHTRSAHA